MAKGAPTIEPNMPWVESNEDRLFKRLTIVLLALFFIAGIILNSMTLPEVAQKNLIDVSPRLAKLIMEKKKVPPPPKVEVPKPEVEKKVEKPKEEPKEKKDETPKKEVKKEPAKEKPKAAREVAQQSGLIALSDELSDLRDSFDLDEVIELPQQKSGKQAVEVAAATDLLTSQATKSSGGIQTSTLSREIKTSELAARETSTVSSNIKSKTAGKVTESASAKSSNNAKRSAEEVELVFQKNKNAIFSIYDRALRKNPSLEGKVVVEIVIEPSGKVSSVKIISSELNDKDLERKLVLKIKRFKFSNKNVGQLTVTYPLDFLPS